MAWSVAAREAAAAARKGRGRVGSSSSPGHAPYSKSKLTSMKLGDKMSSLGADIERVNLHQGKWRVTSKLTPQWPGGMVLSRPSDVHNVVQSHDSSMRRASGRAASFPAPPGARKVHALKSGEVAPAFTNRHGQHFPAVKHTDLAGAGMMAEHNRRAALLNASSMASTRAKLGEGQAVPQVIKPGGSIYENLSKLSPKELGDLQRGLHQSMNNPVVKTGSYKKDLAHGLAAVHGATILPKGTH